MRLVARAVAAGRLRTMAAGAEAIPAHGPVVITARHYHHLYDGAALFAAMPRPFHIVVTLDWAASRASRTIMEKLTRAARWPALLRPDAVRRARRKGRTVFSPQEVLRYRRRAFREAVELLAEGRILVVFPEGYPNIDPHYTPKTGDDEFLPFKSGFLRIVQAAENRLAREIPILPLGLHYAAGRRATAHLRFGSPVDRAAFAGAGLIKQLEREVRKLSVPPV
jgi:putative membrane protein